MSPSLVPILIQNDSVHTTSAYLSKIYFNIIHPPTSTFPSICLKGWRVIIKTLGQYTRHLGRDSSPEPPKLGLIFLRCTILFGMMMVMDTLEMLPVSWCFLHPWVALSLLSVYAWIRRDKGNVRLKCLNTERLFMTGMLFFTLRRKTFTGQKRIWLCHVLLV
jgi:hypothetical protein